MEKSIIKPVILIPLLMVFVTVFSIFFMLPQSLGLDEAQSMWQASHNLSGILYVVAQDVHVPLFHFLLHFWQIAFGNDVSVDRILPLLFYLATIPLVYKLGKVAFNEKIGIFSVVLFALSPFTNWYGSIIRMYSLLAFFTVLNQIFFILIYKGNPEKRKQYWIGYFISSAFGIYTHYFFFFILLTEAVFYFAYRDIFPKRAFRILFAIALVLFILFLPWLLYVRSVGGLGANTSPKLLPPTTVDVANTFSNFFFGFQINKLNTVILSLWPLLTLLLFFALQRNKRVPPEAAFCVMSTLIPILAGAALSNLIAPFYLSRYFIGVFPTACIAVSWFFFLYPESTASIARIGLASAMVVTLGLQTGTASAISPIKEDYRTVANYVTANATARDVVAVSTPFTIYPFEYYYRGTATLTTLPIWNRLISGPIPSYSTNTLEANIATFANNHEYLWLVLSYNQGYEQPLRIYFDTHFERVAMKTFSPDLTLYEYRLNYHETTLTDVLRTASSTTSSSSSP